MDKVKVLQIKLVIVTCGVNMVADQYNVVKCTYMHMYTYTIHPSTQTTNNLTCSVFITCTSTLHVMYVLVHVLVLHVL